MDLDEREYYEEVNNYDNLRRVLREKKRRNKKIKNIIIALVALIVAVAGVFVWDFLNRHIDFSAENFTDVTLEYGEEFQYPADEVLFKSPILFRKGISVPLIREGEADTSKLGTYEITYSAEYMGKTETKKQTVTVVDTVAPVITLVSDPEHYTSPTKPYQEEGYSAKDNYDGDLTSAVVAEEKDGIVTYTVADSSGNKATVTREIIYKDVVKPKITLTGGTQRIKKGNKYSEPGYKATDDVDGDITSKVKVEGSANTSKTGSYTIKYTVEDSSGNKTTAKREVIVYIEQDKQPTTDNDNKNPVTKGKVVYLTFDDGPSSKTAKLLDILDKYGAKATFFVTNQFPKYQNMIAEEYKRGHTVAIHTYSHSYKTVYASTSAYFKDLEKMSDICVKQTGVKPTIIRFPGGTSNTISRSYCKGIMTELAKDVVARGYQYCDWNVTSGDAGEVSTAKAVANNVIRGIKANKNPVVLQHDIYGYSVDAVEEILSWGKANGYQFRALTGSSRMVHHRINN